MTLRWPRTASSAGSSAWFKTQAEDFRVWETAAVAPSGAGEHLFLQIEKTGWSTPAVASWLARTFAVPPVAVGYAGMKDKHAVTTQWFSVQTPRSADALQPEPGLRLLDSARHGRKLRRGELAGNRFEIRLRRLAGDDWAPRLDAIAAAGAPNYFGPQRFGGDNLDQARDWLGARRRRRLPAFRTALYLSVLRSFLFNEVLAVRVRDQSWRTWLAGDVPGGGDPGLPTGPLWGRGRSPAADRALALEQAALAPHAALCDALEHAGPVQQRRSLVLMAADWRRERDGGDLCLGFSLPPGGYATSLLAEAFDLRMPGCGS